MEKITHHTYRIMDQDKRYAIGYGLDRPMDIWVFNRNETSINGDNKKYRSNNWSEFKEKIEAANKNIEAKICSFYIKDENGKWVSKTDLNIFRLEFVKITINTKFLSCSEKYLENLIKKEIKNKKLKKQAEIQNITNNLSENMTDEQIAKIKEILNIKRD